MKDPIQRKFIFTSDGVTHDVTVSETSEALTSCQNYSWAVTPLPSGITGGTPKYTIEVSNDGVIWFEYNSLSTNISIDDAVDDIHLAFTQMRIVHISSGATGGTVEYLMTQKYT